MQRFLRPLAIAAALAALAACAPKASVSERIGTAAGAGEVVDLAKLTPFTWERAVVFGPGTQRRRMCEQLPTAWGDCWQTAPEAVDKDAYMLVFIEKEKLVHRELHARKNGDLCHATCVLELNAADAKFRRVEPAADGRPAALRLGTEAAVRNVPPAASAP